MTVRGFCYEFIRSRSAKTVYRSRSQVADVNEEWFTAEFGHNFMMMFPLKWGMRDFGWLVVPEQQRRGLFRREYEGTTLREHFGIKPPSERHRRS